MLVLSRKAGERILVGEDVAITIVRIGPNTVKVGIDAPKEMGIVREELNRLAASNGGSHVDGHDDEKSGLAGDACADESHRESPAAV